MLKIIFIIFTFTLVEFSSVVAWADEIILNCKALKNAPNHSVNKNENIIFTILYSGKIKNENIKILGNSYIEDSYFMNGACDDPIHAECQSSVNTNDNMISIYKTFHYTFHYNENEKSYKDRNYYNIAINRNDGIINWSEVHVQNYDDKKETHNIVFIKGICEKISRKF